jgi:hypothetical protein
MPPVTTAGKAPLDSGKNVQEAPATIAAQQDQLAQGQGGRKAVMYPEGTKVPGKPAQGMKRIKVMGRGTFDYDPAQTTPAEIIKLSKAGKENELLGLGPVSKPDVEARVAAGETPAAVVETTPAGTEVRAAAGTTETVPAQAAVMAPEATPGNQVSVTTPENVIAGRLDGESKLPDGNNVSDGPSPTQVPTRPAPQPSISSDDTVAGAGPQAPKIGPKGKKVVKGKLKDQVEAAASQAETPTPEQAEANDYAKGKVTLHDMPLAIETPKGGTRTASDGSWEVKDFPAHYGYVEGTKGADGDGVDVFVGDHPDNKQAHIVDQYDPSTGKFDEHKVMLGFSSKKEALDAYDKGFSDGSGPSRRRSSVTKDIDGLKKWMAEGDLSQPATPRIEGTLKAKPVTTEGKPKAEAPKAAIIPVEKVEAARKAYEDLDKVVEEVSDKPKRKVWPMVNLENVEPGVQREIRGRNRLRAFINSLSDEEYARVHDAYRDSENVKFPSLASDALGDETAQIALDHWEKAARPHEGTPTEKVGGKNRTKAEIAKRDSDAAAAKKIFDEHEPDEVQVPTTKAGKDKLLERLTGLLDKAKEADVKIPTKVGYEGTSDHIVYLRDVQTLVNKLRNRTANGDDLRNFLADERMAKAGDFAPLRARRKEVGDELLNKKKVSTDENRVGADDEALETVGDSKITDTDTRKALEKSEDEEVGGSLMESQADTETPEKALERHQDEDDTADVTSRGKTDAEKKGDEVAAKATAKGEGDERQRASSPAPTRRDPASRLRSGAVASSPACASCASATT